MQKVSIVEDDIDIQDILKNHLMDAGYEVAIASDGVAGIAMFDDTIDLVLLDIMLPKIDGYGVCEVIRKRSQVPVIMLTALSDEENQLRGFELIKSCVWILTDSMYIKAESMMGKAYSMNLRRKA